MGFWFLGQQYPAERYERLKVGFRDFEITQFCACAVCVLIKKNNFLSEMEKYAFFNF